jgi:YaiO family outer membrane protein
MQRGFDGKPPGCGTAPGLVRGLGLVCSLTLLLCLTAAWGESETAASPSARREQARAFEAAKQYEPAIASYRAYLEMRPEDDEARGALARLLSWQGAYDEAVMLYTDILTRYPRDLDVQTALARVKSWQQHFAEARRLYEAVLEENPQYHEARRGLADTLSWSGDYALALQHYEVVFAATADPEVGQRIAVVKAALARETSPSPRAPIRDTVKAPTLPYRDYFKIGYSAFAYTKNIEEEQNWLLEAAKPLGTHTLIGRVEILQRFGALDAALSGEFYSPLWSKAWGYVGASIGIDPTFVSRWAVGGEVFQGLGIVHPALSPLELSFGYRHMSFQDSEVDLLIPGITVYLPLNLWLTEKVYSVPDTGALTLSSQLTWRATERLQVFISGAFGTASERVSALQDVVRTSTVTIQGGLTFPLSQKFAAEVVGYYEDRADQYSRAGGIVNFLWHW